MKRTKITLFVMVLAVTLIAAASAHAASVKLPVNGTFKGGGEFAGTFTINRFEVTPNNEIVAVGFVSGVLSRGGKTTVGTVLAGEMEWPVTVQAGGTPVAGSGLAITPAQITCPVLNIALAPLNVNLLGFEVALGAITLDIGGVEGTPLGDLVCSVSDLLGNVAAVVDLLNSILGLLTGLLGGLTGLVPAAA